MSVVDSVPCTCMLSLVVKEVSKLNLSQSTVNTLQQYRKKGEFVHVSKPL